MGILALTHRIDRKIAQLGVDGGAKRLEITQLQIKEPRIAKLGPFLEVKAKVQKKHCISFKIYLREHLHLLA